MYNMSGGDSAMGKIEASSRVLDEEGREGNII